MKTVMGPVTPTMTSGWQASKENTTAPSTDARRTSLTPYCMLVLVNMSREKASAGKMLLRQSIDEYGGEKEVKARK